LLDKRVGDAVTFALTRAFIADPRERVLGRPKLSSDAWAPYRRRSGVRRPAPTARSSTPIR